MRKILMPFFLAGIAFCAYAESADVEVTLMEPGKLEYEIDMSETPDINTLVVKGTLNGKDLITLREAKGKLQTVQTLDLSGVKMVNDEETCYANFQTGVSFIANMYYYAAFYYSDNVRTIEDDGQTGLGVGTSTTRYYVNDFSAVFYNTQAYRKIILPKLASVGDYLLNGNKVVEEVVLPEGITKIGNRSFSGTESMKKLEIPASVESVGNYAFVSAGNVSLRSALHHVGYEAFRNATVKGLDLSEVQTLDEGAFRESKIDTPIDLSRLKVIPPYSFHSSSIVEISALSPELQEIGEYAFAESQLQTIKGLPQAVKIRDAAFKSTPWFKESAEVKEDSQGIIYIASTAYAFSESWLSEWRGGRKEKPSEMKIAEGTKYLGDRLFVGGYCSELSIVRLPNSLLSIGTMTFNRLQKLARIDLPDGLKEIGDHAFESCEALTTINFPNNLVEIGSYAFLDCGSLTLNTFPDHLTKIGEGAFKNCAELNDISFSNNIEEIGKEAFANCTQLRFESLPENIRLIGKDAFSGNTVLTEITLPEKLEDAVDAFNKCDAISYIRLNSIRLKSAGSMIPGLTHMVVGPKVEYIGGFRSEILRRVRFEERNPETPLSIGESAFAWCKNLEECLLPDNTISIEANAFIGDANVNIGTVFPSKIRYVGPCAFSDVETICEVKSHNMEEIPDEAFFGWKGLKAFPITEDIKSIGNGSFAGTGLTSIHIPTKFLNSEKVISPFTNGNLSHTFCPDLKTITFGENPERFNVSLTGTGIEELIVPDGITELNWRMPGTLKNLSLPVTCLKFDRYLLYNSRQAVVSWRMPDNYSYNGDPMQNEIPERWYYDNKTGANLELPEGIGKIGTRAFEFSNIPVLTLPSSLKWIHGYVFDGSSIDLVVFKGEVPPETNTEYISCNRILVPFGTSKAYRGIFKYAEIEEMQGTVNLKFDLDGDKLYLPESRKLSVSVTPSYLQFDESSWSSSDESVAQVFYNQYTPLSAWAYPEKQGTCKITFTGIYRGQEYSVDIPVVAGKGANVDNVEFDDHEHLSIYTVEGVQIAKGVNKDYLKTLLPGVYIVNGHKIFKR